MEHQKLQSKLKEKRDTFDIDDPAQVRKDRVLTEDERARMGPASLLNMAGEDDHEAERRTLQQEQMRRWVHEQMAEREMVKAREKMEDKEYAAYLEEMGQLRDQAEKEMAEAKKREVMQARKANELLVSVMKD